MRISGEDLVWAINRLRGGEPLAIEDVHDLASDLRDLRELARDFIDAERRFSTAAEMNCSVDSRLRHLAHKAFEAIKTHLEGKP